MVLQKTLPYCLALLLGLAPHAEASIGQTVEWSGAETAVLKELSLRNYTAPSHLRSSPDDPQFVGLLQMILSNADGRIAEPFSIPDALRPQVEFWLRVFTQWHSRQAILVDEYHLDWVYAVIDLSIPRARAQFASTQKQYQQAIRRLATLKSASKLSPIERNVWQAWGQPQLPVTRMHGHRTAELVQQLHVQRGARDALIRALALSEPYLPKMEAIFSQQELPPELTRLSLLESAFQFDAVSKVGARGLWQFMERTAREYLLLAPRASIDERLSPWKSTVAASLLLRGNRAQLGNWFSAITAYNHGFRGLARTNDLDGAVQKLVTQACRGKSPLGWASRNYYAEFLAVLYAEAFHAELFGDKPTLDIRPVRFIALAQATTARDLAMNLNLPLPELMKLNPDLEAANRRLPRGHLIAVPAAKDDFRSLFTRQNAPLLTAERGGFKKARLQ